MRTINKMLLLLVLSMPVLLMGGPPTEETKSKISLQWDANPVEDNVTGYKIYYGTTPGEYPDMIDVGNVTVFSIRGLPAVAHTFVVTAYNAYDLESLPSDPVTGIPKTAPGRPKNVQLK